MLDQWTAWTREAMVWIEQTGADALREIAQEQFINCMKWIENLQICCIQMIRHVVACELASKLTFHEAPSSALRIAGEAMMSDLVDRQDAGHVASKDPFLCMHAAASFDLVSLENLQAMMYRALRLALPWGVFVGSFINAYKDLPTS
jgi:hypothetical protein